MKTLLTTLSLAFLIVGITGAHCQIPCGIYDDAARIQTLKEHVNTIEKSMKMITDISCNSPQDSNQMVRWVNNKESHADQLTDIVTYYFLAQRIKPEAEHYDDQLKTLHSMMISAMKAKQTVDLEQVSILRALIAKFETLYHAH